MNLYNEQGKRDGYCYLTMDCIFIKRKTNWLFYYKSD